MWTASFLLLLAAPTLTLTQHGGRDRQRRAAAQATSGSFSSASGDGYAYGGGGGGAGGGDSFVFPGQAEFGPGAIHSVLRNYLDQMEAMFSQQQQQAYSGGAGAGFGDGGNGAAQAAHAALALGNRGGFASAGLFPDAGPSSRIATDLPPASGGPIGVFSSSSSSSHVDESGKTHTFKQATVGVNDNGKVKIFSVKDP